MCNKFNNIVIIPGAPKSGTTTLYHDFVANNFISSNLVKEPHFFSLDETTIENNFSWYKNLFPSCDQIKVDASTNYFNCERFLQNIKKYTYNPKIILLLRDPAKRVFSQYHHMAKKTPTSLEQRSLDRMISEIRGGSVENVRYTENLLIERGIKEEKIKANYLDKCYLQRFVGAPFESFFADPMLPYRYFYNSCYSSFVEKLVENVGLNHVKVVFFENFINCPRETLCEVAEFLDIEMESSDIVVSRSKNVTQVPRNRISRLVWYAREQKVIPDILMKTLYRLGKEAGVQKIKNFFVYRPEISEDLYHRIAAKLDFEYEYWLEKYPVLKEYWRY